MTSPTRRGWRWLHTAAAVAGTALIAGVGAFVTSPAHSQEAARRTPALPARYTEQKPAWHACAADEPQHECATIEAPLDYRRPAGAAITVAISRIRASSQEHRRGILLLNPGGPGGEGIDMPLQMRDQLPRKVLDRYDLIGFDPRGIGRSSAVTCAAPASAVQVPRPDNFDQQVAGARGYAAACGRSSPAVPHITTRNTARDMDLIRAALGERRLSYFGLSYGTYLGAVYTQLFGHRADRIVLDSGIDPALAWRGHIQAGAAGAEAAFRRWAAWTAQRDATYHLGATPEAVRRTFWDLVARADRTPIPIDGGTETGAAIRSRAASEFVFLRSSAERIAALKKAAAGTPAGTARSGPEPEPEPSGDMAIVCNDARWPRDPETYRRDALRDGVRHPLSGYESSSIMPCAFWPTEHAEPPTTVRNAVGALIVQNEWDPATPAEPAMALHRALGGSRLVLVDEGEGHIVYGEGNRCADAAVDDYLITGRLPAADVTCPAKPEAA